jgi:putative restriction endonuclease
LDVLDAAHIVPFVEAVDEQKISANKGLLLGANHHRLFDSGKLKILKDYSIRISDI